MTEKFSFEEQKIQFQQSVTQMLQDSKIDPEEAVELRKKYDLEKKEIISFHQPQLSLLKDQFGNELSEDNFTFYIQELSKKYLETRIPNKELLYDGVTDFLDFQQTGGIKIDFRNPQKHDTISKEDWDKAQYLIKIAKKSKISDGKISFTKENGIVLELDTNGSNVYIKLDGDNIILTGQYNRQFFVESLSQSDFSRFVKNYNTDEYKRIVESLGFTGGLTFGGILSFSLRTGISWFLGYLGTGLGLYKGYQLFKSYHLGYNDAVDVLRDHKNNPDGVKSYLYLAQVGYIQGYNKGRFFTIDGEYLTVDQLTEKEKNIQPLQYQLLKELKEKDFRPKKLESGKYELDMIGLFDKTRLHFEGDTVQFATSSFEQGKVFTFSNVKEAFEKIQTINEILKLEMELKSKQSYENSYEFHNVTAKMEEKIKKMKIQLSN